MHIDPLSLCLRTRSPLTGQQLKWYQTSEPDPVSTLARSPAGCHGESLGAGMDAATQARQLPGRPGRRLRPGGTAGLGSSGWKILPEWVSRQEMLSGRFTTALTDLPVARC
ncbi:DUF4113 domain-containing protein [Xanthomonas citri pv. phaseoli var. fuscans]|uniref:DUF4113 domain-containing protein n=2 Tax=Xanthomonas TaxID=338 RepID=UPI000D503530|nr:MULTISPECIES: DUF4113 domain-containing protein [Xanthomonas]QTD88014.1 DUF4113 domain-containing protein [Xanthomonas citri pv. phaseoli var. fuscans]QWN20540.1 hypothetical protein DGM98_10710 [Xanthomonas citri]QTF14093.1 DUF4113 domain-containing protein [Xanthomonas citri pv. phaseoli var. fuscans]QTF14318.1 DUF4113 domain-containing protein [Xanthomonas citri pv. phaseoli var. fuscans]QTF76294.1 DUF4113 domain-containing protein [Xanthomonas citri pv. phaseoli var. fuscans]